MKTILNSYKLILGSQSPRRSQLLDELDIPFIRRVISIDEDFPSSIPYQDVAEYLAIQKGLAHKPTIQSDEVVLTADSIVAVDDKILGKPKNRKEAIDFLQLLSNNIHEVITGVSLLSNVKMRSFSTTAKVKIKSIDDREIEYYIDQFAPYDKAGGYGIQEWLGHAKIEYIHGTYTNIMGLPTSEVYEALKSFCTEDKNKGSHD